MFKLLSKRNIIQKYIYPSSIFHVITSNKKANTMENNKQDNFRDLARKRPACKLDNHHCHPLVSVSIVQFCNQTPPTSSSSLSSALPLQMQQTHRQRYSPPQLEESRHPNTHKPQLRLPTGPEDLQFIRILGHCKNVFNNGKNNMVLIEPSHPMTAITEYSNVAEAQ